jgi:DNA-binding transcriptional LysR family regulator
MPRQLPSLNALRAFEAAARSESFTRAAEELCVTQGAVSHQVKLLEATLGIKLFNRERQRLVITDAGREYLNVVRDALDRIAAGTERVVQRQNSGALTVSTSPDFAAKWLVYRLGRFAEAHPDRLCSRGGRRRGPARRRRPARGLPGQGATRLQVKRASRRRRGRDGGCRLFPERGGNHRTGALSCASLTFAPGVS